MLKRLLKYCFVGALVVEAPRGKQLIWFEQSGHWPQLNETTKFQEAMIGRVLKQTRSKPADCPHRNKDMQPTLKDEMAAAALKTIGVSEPLVSVIIPALGEANSLGDEIAAVQKTGVPFEVVVVDAGADDTPQIAASASAIVVHGIRRQRAFQLNLGARKARGAILLFLHADTLLPPHALDSILKALQDPDVVGGAFARRYESPSLVLRFTCFLAHQRNQLIGWHLGDQAMFVRRATFFQLEGFREVARFEDLDFSRRLRNFGRTVTLRPCVISSLRRYERLGPANHASRSRLDGSLSDIGASGD